MVVFVAGDVANGIDTSISIRVPGQPYICWFASPTRRKRFTCNEECMHPVRKTIELGQDDLVRARQRVVGNNGWNRHEQTERSRDQGLADRARDLINRRLSSRAICHEGPINSGVRLNSWNDLCRNSKTLPVFDRDERARHFERCPTVTWHWIGLCLSWTPCSSRPFVANGSCVIVAVVMTALA